MGIDFGAVAAGLVAALVLAVIVVVRPQILQTEGLCSTAKLQFFIWTEVVLFAFGFLFTAHAAARPGGVFVWCKEKDKNPVSDRCPKDYEFTDQGPTIPQNLLLLMGLSITAAAVSRAKGQPPSTVAAVKARVASKVSLGAFIRDGDAPGDEISLPKAQMLAWTIVAATAYIYTVLAAYPDFVNATAKSYPNVDGALLALLGLGQGAFVANRFADKNSTD